MTREEAIERLKNYTQYRCGGVDLVALNMAIQALESQPRFLVHSDGKIEQIIEPCDDCVSRQAVLDYISRLLNQGTGKKKSFEFIQKFVEKLPSVIPKREQGEWCEQNDDYFDWYECSECGYGSEGEMQYSSEHDVRTKYCPNCGAEMR